jgi:hypothetical protein
MVTSLFLAVISVRRGSVMTSVPVQKSAEGPSNKAPEAEQAAAPAEGEAQKAPAALPAPAKESNTEAK